MKRNPFLRLVVLVGVLCASHAFAGDFSIREVDARDFSKKLTMCIKAGNSECIIALTRDPVVLDHPKKFGCTIANERPLATPKEFEKCVLDPAAKTARKPTLREIVLNCLSPKAKFDDHWIALKGSKGYFCLLDNGEVIGDEMRITQVSAAPVSR